MDLLFKRYASPFLFIDGMIQTGRFCEFVSSFTKAYQKEQDEETSWQYFLHKVYEGSYADFKRELKANSEHQNLPQRTIETTLKHSMSILQNFNPEEKGGES